MDLGGSSEGWMTTHERRASALRFDTGGVYPKPAEPPLPGILRGRLFRGRTALIVGLAAVAPGCANLNLFSVNQDAELGAQAYTEILGPEKLITSGADHAMVTRLMEELVEAARYEEPAMVDAFEWEVSLIDNDEVVNAFALPGGKMAVYTGILPVAGSDAGLAVVMGHEIGHVIERHGTEAMTRQYGAAVLIEIVTDGAAAKELANVASSLVHLKFGRSAELEADRRGLMYMARAGYDPREAREFWTRMSQMGGDAPPEWLSTHPSHENRIRQIEELLKEAVPIYEANKASN